jgi:cobyrinic acid a,c-diamide synthase
MQAFMISGTHSGCGKTTITLGVCAALVKRGIAVQTFKAGPDFIDAGIHRLASGRNAINLDLWMCGEDTVRATFCRYAPLCDISVIEGVMGLFDGTHCSAALAGILGVPVILVIDAFGMAESAAAVVYGYAAWAANSGVTLAGVIFNRVASESHYRRLVASISDLTVLGYLPRTDDLAIAARHLGLTTADEQPLTRIQVEKLACLVEDHIDLDQLVSCSTMLDDPCERMLGRGGATPLTVKIAIARDVAFSFYYEENLQLLREAGAEIVSFSPLWDTDLPDNIDAIYLGGGYPELYADRLSENTTMRSAIASFIASGGLVYAECGGLMYLSQGICDLADHFFPMVGSLPFSTRMKRRRAQLGYREITLITDCFLGRAGGTVRGHEFHYSEIETANAGLTTVYLLKDAQGAPLASEGYMGGNVLCSYIHVHFASNPRTARHFVNHVKEKAWKK